MNRFIKMALCLIVLSLAPRSGALASSPNPAWQWVGPADKSGVNSRQVWHGGVAYGNGKFIIANGYEGGKYTSSDGLEWIRSDHEGPLLLVYYANGQWLGVASTGNGKCIQTSLDGITWKYAVDIPMVSTSVFDIAYGNGQYVLLLSGGRTVVTDGVKPLTVGDMGYVNTIVRVAYGNGRFIGAGSNKIWSSTDGLSWAQVATAPEGTDFCGVSYGNGRFMVVDGSEAGLVYVSKDGEIWEQSTSGKSGLAGVIYGGDRFLLWNQDVILSSEDGVTFVSEANPAGLARFCYGGGRFIAVDSGRTLMTAVLNPGVPDKPSNSTGVAQTPAIGTPVGNVLETDIVARVNGDPILSFNIDNETAIVAEDLQNYGFDVTWNPERRTLVVSPSPGKPVTPPPLPLKTNVRVGRKIGTVLYTDIKTFVGSSTVRSFNLGGKTAIVIDDLGMFGTVTWDPKQRVISVTMQ
ncbi:MAG: hypothetical protein ACM3X4_06425 [Ignavibacteriales bacterium]